MLNNKSLFSAWQKAGEGNDSDGMLQKDILDHVEKAFPGMLSELSVCLKVALFLRQHISQVRKNKGKASAQDDNTMLKVRKIRKQLLERKPERLGDHPG